MLNMWGLAKRIRMHSHVQRDFRACTVYTLLTTPLGLHTSPSLTRLQHCEGVSCLNNLQSLSRVRSDHQ